MLVLAYFGQLDMQVILPKKTTKMYMHNWETTVLNRVTTVLSYLPTFDRLLHDRLV